VPFKVLAPAHLGIAPARESVVAAAVSIDSDDCRRHNSVIAALGLHDCRRADDARMRAGAEGGSQQKQTMED
jgi:hypothetical protein